MRIILFAALVSLIACSQPKPEAADQQVQTETVEVQNILTEAEKTTGWQSLFDGTSTEQWRGYLKEDFPEEGWTVTDGELTVIKGGGDLITKEQYGNFELILDYKLETEGANSGIFYLAIESEGEPIYHNAPEFQILDNVYHTTDQDSAVYKNHLAGDNYDLHAGENDYTNGLNEWNTIKLVHNNGKVEHYMNGNKTIEYEINSADWKKRVAGSKFKEYPNYGLAKSGHIGLQDHNNKISFRNLKIKKL